MRPKVYVETSVISYLVARRNQRDLLVASNQELTHEWWETRRDKFELCVSAVVLAEASRGDPTFAAARIEVARELTLVETPEAAMDLANALVERAALPQNAFEDALSYCNRSDHWDGFPAELELQAHRECVHHSEGQWRHPKFRIRAAADLHATGAHGGLKVRNDPIVEETRAARRELHEQFREDRAALFHYLKDIEREHADRLVTLAPKPAVQTNPKVS